MKTEILQVCVNSELPNRSGIYRVVVSDAPWAYDVEELFVSTGPTHTHWEPIGPCPDREEVLARVLYSLHQLRKGI